MLHSRLCTAARVRFATLALLPPLVAASPIAAQTVSIDFDDGTPGQTIDDFYSTLGVTFSHARWADALGPPFDGVDDHLGSTLPYVVIHSTSSTILHESDPIAARFEPPVSSVSLRAMDVGSAGIRVNAYDDATAGTLVASDSGTGAGSGTGNPVDLFVSAPLIRRIEVFQPNTPIMEGTLLDNLEFTPVATPSVPALSAPALAALVAGLVAASRFARRQALARPSGRQPARTGSADRRG